MGPFLAVRRLLREGWPIVVRPLGELPWPTKLGRNVTSLALVLSRQPCKAITGAALRVPERAIPASPVSHGLVGPDR